MNGYNRDNTGYPVYEKGKYNKKTSQVDRIKMVLEANNYELPEGEVLRVKRWLNNNENNGQINEILDYLEDSKPIKLTSHQSNKGKAWIKKNALKKNGGFSITFLKKVEDSKYCGHTADSTRLEYAQEMVESAKETESNMVFYGFVNVGNNYRDYWSPVYGFSVGKKLSYYFDAGHINVMNVLTTKTREIK